MIEVLFVAGLFTIGPVLVLIIGSSFLVTLGRVLRRVSPENRRMEPGQVWLNLIPVFNFVWWTVTVERVAESLRNEFRERGMDGPSEQYGRKSGLTVLVLLASGCLLYAVPGCLFYAGFLCCAIAFFYWIGYWRQLNQYVKRLKSGAYSPPPIDEGW
jgi:ABC-type dipeptide/oligopeptide/nickel transport system permease subunit